MKRTFEIQISEEFEPMFRGFMRAAGPAFTEEDLIKRFIANGLSYEVGKPVAQGDQIVNRFFRVKKK